MVIFSLICITSSLALSIRFYFPMQFCKCLQSEIFAVSLSYLATALMLSLKVNPLTPPHPLPSVSLQISLGDALITAGAQLVELDLSDNAFGPDGVRGFEALLKSSACYTLQELKLNNCGMGIGGGKVRVVSFLRMTSEPGLGFTAK